MTNLEILVVIIGVLTPLATGLGALIREIVVARRENKHVDATVAESETTVVEKLQSLSLELLDKMGGELRVLSDKAERLQVELEETQASRLRVLDNLRKIRVELQDILHDIDLKAQEDPCSFDCTVCYEVTSKILALVEEILSEV